jgi:hypothetical protein
MRDCDCVLVGDEIPQRVESENTIIYGALVLPVPWIRREGIPDTEKIDRNPVIMTSL